MSGPSLICYRGSRGERCSAARRRSRRHWYARNAEQQRRKARAYYHANREKILRRKRRKWAERLRAHPYWRRLTEQEWADVKRFYQVANRTEPYTFWELALQHTVSPRAIQRRSSKDGGWSLRATPEQP